MVSSCVWWLVRAIRETMTIKTAPLQTLPSTESNRPKVERRSSVDSVVSAVSNVTGAISTVKWDISVLYRGVHIISVMAWLLLVIASVVRTRPIINFTEQDLLLGIVPNIALQAVTLIVFGRLSKRLAIEEMVSRRGGRVTRLRNCMHLHSLFLHQSNISNFTDHMYLYLYTRSAPTIRCQEAALALRIPRSAYALERRLPRPAPAYKRTEKIRRPPLRRVVQQRL
jgi:hypothetical protein